MKKFIIAPLVLAAAACMMSTGCTNRNQNMGAFRFDSICTNNTAHLLNDTANPSCEISIRFTYIKESSDKKMEDSLNHFLIKNTFDSISCMQPAQKAVMEYQDRYVRNYLAELTPEFKEQLSSAKERSEEEPLMACWFCYTENNKTAVTYYSNSLLVYNIYQDMYTGGAHGAYRNKYLNIDLRKLDIIRLDEIFTGDYQEVLTEAIINRLMKDNKVSTKEELLNMGFGITGDIRPTENFILGKNGITFHYNIYEIAPYCMGETEVSIPYKELEKILDTDYLKGLDNKLNI